MYEEMKVREMDEEMKVREMDEERQLGKVSVSEAVWRGELAGRWMWRAKVVSR